MQRKTVNMGIMGKIPPQAVDLEIVVLGAILIEREAMIDIADFLRPEAFYHEAHKQIYAAIQSLSILSSPIDIMTVTAELRKRGQLEMVGGAYYITNLTSRVTSSANIESHARLIQEAYIKRELIRSSSELISGCYSDENDVFDLLSKSEYEKDELLQSITVRKEVTNEDLMRETLSQMEKKKNGPSGLTGVPSGFQAVDAITAGWQPSDLIIIAARPGMGKEQSVDSLISTPKGFVRMGDVSVGHEVFASDGSIQTVTGVFPQGIKKLFRVHFSDETSTLCGLNHLWLTKSRKERVNKKPASVKSFKEILDTIEVNADGRKNHSIQYVKPVKYPKNQLLINPYLMGVLLGDGCMSRVSISNPEMDIFKKVSVRIPKGTKISIEKDNKRVFSYCIIGEKRPTNALKSHLKIYGLDKSLSHNKFIPLDYLQSSIDDRSELLRGLLDTDGYVANKCSIEYSTTSEMLKDNILELVRSLGGRSTFSECQGKYTKNEIEHVCKKYYRINISFSNGIIPVSSEKHLKKYRGSQRSLEKFITKVEEVESNECQCISVSSNDNLYVTDDFIVTHNTSFALQNALNASFEYNIPGAVFSLEMSKVQLMKKELAIMCDIPLVKFVKNQLMDWDWAKVHTMTEKIAAAPIHWDDTPALSLVEFCAKCRRLKKKYDIQYIIIDYLQLMILRLLNKGNREQEIGGISRGLKGLAKELNIPVLALSQLSRAVESRPGNGKRPMLSDLRESGSIEQDADVVIFIYRPEYYGIEEDEDGNSTEGVAEIIIAKHRNGETDDVPLMFSKKTTGFSNYEAPGVNYNDPSAPVNYVQPPAKDFSEHTLKPSRDFSEPEDRDAPF